MEARRGSGSRFSGLQAEGWKLTRGLEDRYMQAPAPLVPMRLLMDNELVRARFGFSPQTLARMGTRHDVLMISPMGGQSVISILSGQDIGRGNGGASFIRHAYVETVRRLQMEMARHQPDSDEDTLRYIALSLFDLLPSGPGSTQEELRAQGLAPETVLTVLEE